MGGDFGPSVVVPAAARVLKERPELTLVLVGDEPKIQCVLDGLAPLEFDEVRLPIVHATEQVEMGELPSLALRTKKNSSMRLAIDLVKAGQADACVSAGNTGALMITAKFVLKTLPGIDRPAIISPLPAMSGHTYVLDLGANVDSTGEQLFQFAVMGAALVQAVDDVQTPTIGLLNIGQEEIKGTESIKTAARLLADSDLQYAGFVEGDDIYKGTVNVVVCDGLVGNVSLKSSEGVAKMIAGVIREEFSRSWWTRLAGIIALPVLRAVRGRIDPREYNGATLAGLQGIVVKSHGSADARSFANAIREAAREVETNLPGIISARLDPNFSREEAV